MADAKAPLKTRLKEALFKDRENRFIDYQMYGGAGGPLWGTSAFTYGKLSGDRLKAYRRQWRLTTAILFIFAVAILVLAFAITNDTVTLGNGQVMLMMGSLLVVLLAVRYIYAFSKHETYFQLLNRERESTSTRSQGE